MSLSSSEPDLNHLLANSSGEETMEHEELVYLDDSLNPTEQDQQVDKSETAMEVTPSDQLVIVVPEAKIVTEASLQEIVPAIGNQVTNEAEEEENENDDEEDSLDRYLDTMMIDMTMSIVKVNLLPS